MVNIKFVKTHPDAQLPKRNHENIRINQEEILGTGDTGYDIFSVEEKTIQKNNSNIVDTGLQIAYIDPKYWFLIMPRSGLGFKHGIQPHIGTIDNSYRGNCGVKLYNFSDKDYIIKKGDKVAQLIVFPLIECEINWTDEIINTNRGDKGFGSSGR